MKNIYKKYICHWIFISEGTGYYIELINKKEEGFFCWNLEFTLDF